MINTLKTFFALLLLMGFLAACSSNSDMEEADTGYEEIEEMAPEPEPELAPQPVVIDADTVFYFEFDQSTLNSAARSALMIHAEQLKAAPRSIRLEGHADERGSREYNMALGERRANAVRDFLVLQGVDSYLIETVSYGEERPASMGSYEGSWEQNRRVELR